MAKAEEGLGERAFAIWLMRNPEGLKGLLVAALYVLIVAARNISDVSSLNPFVETYNKNRDLFNSMPSLVQCLALLPPLWWCFRASPPTWTKDDVANRACIQFAKCLTALVASWIIFYLLNFIDQNHWAPNLEPWIDFCNNLQAVFLFACYWTLTAITVPDHDSDDPTASKSLALPLIFSYALWTILVFHLADLGLAMKAPDARFWCQFLSGMAVGICMSLMVGCLESEYLGSPRALTACLYSYAVLQLAYVGFNPPTTLSSGLMETCRDQILRSFSAQTNLQLFSTLTSLPLKFLFIGLCYWHLQTGRLAFYMERTRMLIKKDVPEQWQEFLTRKDNKT